MEKSPQSQKVVLRKVLITGIIVIHIILFSIVSVVTISSIILLNRGVTSEFEQKDEYNEYQILQFNHLTGEISYGFTTISEHLGDDQYISYEDSRGGNVLISNFEKEEFICEGSCYCSNTRRITSTATFVTQGLIYLVAASTSLLAFQYARDHFEDVCRTRLSSDCPVETIKSEISHCESSVEVVNSEKDEEDVDDEETATSQETSVDAPLEQTDETGIGTKFWNCKGWCVTDVNNLVENTYKGYSKSYNFFKKFVGIFPDKKSILEGEGDVCNQLSKTIVYQTETASDLESAKEEFRAAHLKDLCGEVVDITGRFTESERKKIVRRMHPFKNDLQDFKILHGCWEGDMKLDQNIHCRKVESNQH